MDNFDFNMDLDLGDFSDMGIDLNDSFQSRYMKPPKVKEIPEKLLKYSNAEKMANEIKIEKGSRFFAIINGSFISGDLFEALIVKNNWHVKKMTISTLSLSQNNIDSLNNLITGDYLDELNLIVSDYFYSHERGNLIPYIYQELDIDDKFQLAVAGTHCKTCHFETHCGLKVVIHGSANMRSSGNIEQIVIEENEELYKFNDEYQQNIIDKFKTINKSIRSKNLWDAVKLK